MFLDFVRINVKSGNGGAGAVTFRREKYVPRGGPSGGNGGDGGSIIFVADRNMNTLIDFNYKKIYLAESGVRGGSSLKDGKFGKDLLIKVPVGTLIKKLETEEVIADLDTDKKQVVLLKGGRGGKGNSNFATATNQAPRYAEPGMPGYELNLILELKLIADVGLVGFPNAGKSTFLSVVSAAKPKIADYPFTTLEPMLGIVKYKEGNSFLLADIPGIIEDAHLGKGLGHKFLKHIERTKVLLILIDSSSENIQQQYDTLVSELKNFSKTLAGKKKIVAFSKADILSEDERKAIKKLKLKNYKDKTLLFSSAANINVEEVIARLWTSLQDY